MKVMWNYYHNKSPLHLISVTTLPCELKFELDIRQSPCRPIAKCKVITEDKLDTRQYGAFKGHCHARSSCHHASLAQGGWWSHSSLLWLHQGIWSRQPQRLGGQTNGLCSARFYKPVDKFILVSSASTCYNWRRMSDWRVMNAGMP